MWKWRPVLLSRSPITLYTIHLEWNVFAVSKHLNQDWRSAKKSIIRRFTVACYLFRHPTSRKLVPVPAIKTPRLIYNEFRLNSNSSPLNTSHRAHYNQKWWYVKIQSMGKRLIINHSTPHSTVDLKHSIPIFYLIIHSRLKIEGSLKFKNYTHEVRWCRSAPNSIILSMDSKTRSHKSFGLYKHSMLYVHKHIFMTGVIIYITKCYIYAQKREAKRHIIV